MTTSLANDRNAIRFLRPAPSTRNPLHALDMITAAGAKSKNSVVRDAYECFASLPLAQRQALFHATYLLDGSLTATEVESALGAALHYAAHPRQRTALFQRLEGWWFQTVIRHLADEGPPAIPVSLVQGRVFEIQEDFRRESLPDDQWNAALPDDASPGDDGRTFVRQLRIIGVTAGPFALRPGGLTIGRSPSDPDGPRMNSWASMRSQDTNSGWWMAGGSDLPS